MLDQIQRIDYDQIDPQIRRNYATASVIALVGNSLLLVSKVLVTILSESSAIRADAANSAADVAYSLLMIIGLFLALRPADLNHPHGHRRIEPLVSLAIGLLMAFAGYEAARGGLAAWISGPRIIGSGWALLMPILAAACKAVMYSLVHGLGKDTQSLVLLASARDHLTDVIATMVVLLGVGASRMGFALADPLAAFLVALWIFWAAFEVLRESINQLIGGAPSAAMTEAVIAAVQSVPEVVGIHQVIIEYVGPQVRADIHINLPGDHHLDETHRIGDAVQRAVERLPEVDHAFVHVEPDDSHD